MTAIITKVVVSYVGNEKVSLIKDLYRTKDFLLSNGVIME